MKVAVVFGTRPEAIKLAPVIKKLKETPCIETKIVVTAQHREMLDQVLSLFDIIPDYDLNLMTESQSLFDITTKSIERLGQILNSEQPDVILIQGDTTTTFTTALAAFYLKIRVGHIEAGLRSFNKYQPFPEEINRRLTSTLADIHFAPTQTSKENLLREGFGESTIFVTGNTVVDALYWVIDNKQSNYESEKISKNNKILVTIHRRENWDEGIEKICKAIIKIIKSHNNVEIIFSCHLNPKVKKMVNAMLNGYDAVNITDPLDYATFVHLINTCDLILTDSGGVQEEAVSLKKPLLLARSVTERPECVESGYVRLVGTDIDLIRVEVAAFLNGTKKNNLTGTTNPFGKGHASEKIVEILTKQIC